MTQHNVVWKNLPVKHLSMSAIKDYLSDRQRFYKTWIRKEWSNTSSVSVTAGTGVHYCMEQFYTRDFTDMEQLADEYIDATFQKIADNKLVITGKEAEDPEKLRKKLRDMIIFGAKELMEYVRAKSLYDPKGVELAIVSPLTLPGRDTPITPVAFKGKMDLVTKSGVIVDWKSCSSFDSEKETPDYTMQGIGYALLYLAQYKTLPKQILFVEVKLSKNRDGSPQVREIVVTMDDWKFRVFAVFFDRICRELCGQNLTINGEFLPNPFAMFGWADGWHDFCMEILGYNPYTGEVRPQQTIMEQVHEVATSMSAAEEEPAAEEAVDVNEIDKQQAEADASLQQLNEQIIEQPAKPAPKKRRPYTRKRLTKEQSKSVRSWSDAAEAMRKAAESEISVEDLPF